MNKSSSKDSENSTFKEFQEDTGVIARVGVARTGVARVGTGGNKSYHQIETENIRFERENKFLKFLLFLISITFMMTLAFISINWADCLILGGMGIVVLLAYSQYTGYEFLLEIWNQVVRIFHQKR